MNAMSVMSTDEGLWQAVLARDAHARGHIVGALGEHEEPGRPFDERGVPRVQAPLERIVDDRIGAERFG